MKLGDALEVLGFTAATGAALYKGGWFPALIVVAVAFLYLAQCHGTTPFPWPKGAVARLVAAYRRQLEREQSRRSS